MGVKIEYFIDKLGRKLSLDKLFQYDDTSGMIVTIPIQHSRIHDGSFYVVKGFVDIATNAVTDFQITTPDCDKQIHMFGQFSTETEFQFNIYERATIVTPGTPQTPRNRNRNYPDASLLTVAIIDNASVGDANADTAVADADTLFSVITGAGKKSGGENRADHEFILMRNTIYCFRLICISAGWADFVLNWYEN